MYVATTLWCIDPVRKKSKFDSITFSISTTLMFYPFQFSIKCALERNTTQKKDRNFPGLCQPSRTISPTEMSVKSSRRFRKRRGGLRSIPGLAPDIFRLCAQVWRRRRGSQNLMLPNFWMRWVVSQTINMGWVGVTLGGPRKRLRQKASATSSTTTKALAIYLLLFLSFSM